MAESNALSQQPKDFSDARRFDENTASTFWHIKDMDATDAPAFAKAALEHRFRDSIDLA